MSPPGPASAAAASASATTPECRVAPLADATRAALQSLLDRVADKNAGRGGAVLRIETLGCGALWEGAAGRLEESDAPMTTAATFEIASVTKLFTAVVALQLVEEAKLTLATPLGALLPAETTRGLLVVDGWDFGSELTVRDLLGHLSGLPDVWTDGPFVRAGINAFDRDFALDPDRFWQPGEVVAYAKKLRPIGPPGARHHYGDTGFVLLGLALERLTGKPLETLYRERVLAPLGLHDTHLSYREAAPVTTVASHRFEVALDIYGQRRQSADWASGGLISSTRDLAAFADALAHGTPLFRNAITRELLQSWHPTGVRDIDYGLGAFHIRLDRGQGDLWGHDGHGNAFLYLWPARGLAFIGTLNQTQNDWWPLVAGAIELLKL